MHIEHYSIKFFLPFLLCLLCGCTVDHEAVFLQNLSGGLTTLGKSPPDEALIIHNELYSQATELEKRGHARKLNMNRVIGILALRRAMLAEITKKAEMVPKCISEAMDRFDRGGILPKNKPKPEQDVLFDQFVSTILELEEPTWKEELYRVWIKKGLLVRGR